MRHYLFLVFAFAVSVMLLAVDSSCLAIGGTDKIASAGQSVRGIEGWPQGVTEFVNLPSRTGGLHRWYSGRPNDTRSYSFRVDSDQELQQLIQQFAKIESDKLSIVFVSPAEDEERPKLRASLLLGNQLEIDRWYAHLETDDQGRKGARRYIQTPVAMPPTLWITLRKPADADGLDIPANVAAKKPVAKQGQSSIALPAE